MPVENNGPAVRGTIELGGLKEEKRWGIPFG
jgi:hypothetical protein